MQRAAQGTPRPRRVGTASASAPSTRTHFAVYGHITHRALLGVTGSGKTATMAWLVELVQRPTLVLAHNKTLAALLVVEFQEFFPENAVE